MKAPLVRRKSGIAGSGVFTTRPIEKRTRIVEYKGELIPRAEGLRREERYAKRGRLWTFVVNSRWIRDAGVGGNIARYINHACRPNCYVDIIGRNVWILAKRRIRAGEELTYDYNSDGYCAIQCQCRKGCRRVL
jgi:SET domain-containing protein